MPTSSLINCPQGHVYSAVYQFCPYCPQPEPVSQAGPQSDFATRIEEPVTAVEPPNQYTTAQPSPSFSLAPEEFSANAEPFATNFETRLGSSEEFETRLGGAEMFETRVGAIEVNDVLEHRAATQASAATPQKSSAPTEVISQMAETTIAEMPAVKYEPPPPPPAETPVSVFPTQPPPHPPQPEFSKAATYVAPDLPESPLSETQSPGKSSSYATTSPDERRTIVVADEGALPQSSKGKIVGWVISYNRTPDGDDYRIYAGYNRIGANPVCDIVLEDETVSGSHAIIVYRDGRFLIKDDLSRNGTFVNGREITEAHPLQNYDQIRVGNTYLTFIAAQRIAG